MSEIQSAKTLFVKQVFEVAEWLGFETRNKYHLMDENRNVIGFAAEQQKGVGGFLMRQFLGHWRSFDIHFFNNQRHEIFQAHHPFRWFFQRLIVFDNQGRVIGAIQRRFSILTKRFDIENAQGNVIMEVSSPVWKIWTFNFMSRGQQMASIKKKWSGLFSEGLTDRDNFMIEFTSPTLTAEERHVLVASAVFIDLMYFENKGGGGLIGGLDLGG